MKQEFSRRWREALATVLARNGKSAGYWSAPLTVRMSDNAGDLLYKILGEQSSGWLQDGEKHLLNGCQCTMTIANAGGGKTYRRFHLCQRHAEWLFRVPGDVRIANDKPAIKMRQLKQEKSRKHQKKCGPGDALCEDSLFGWHDGVYVQSGGLPGLGKRK